MGWQEMSKLHQVNLVTVQTIPGSQAFIHQAIKRILWNKAKQ
jgi:hypothetical protein